MSKLEQLIKKEYKEHKSERLFVFYSVSISPPTKLSEQGPSEPSISFDSLSAYADSLNKQYGVPSPIVEPEAPSKPVSPETFNPVEVMQAINKPYKSILSEEETAYATILSKQSNIPSSVIEPLQVPSNSVDPKTFDLGQALIAINDFTHSSISSNFITPSSAKPAEGYIYNPPEFKTSEIVTPKFEPINIPDYKGGISSKDEIFHSKPYKYFDNFRKNELKTIAEDTYTKSDIHNVLNLFKNNDLPSIYEKIKQNLHMKPKSVTTITLTNPLYTKSADEEGPVFIKEGNNNEIRLPVTQPKFIPFVKTDQQEYRDIVLNSFLPHEQAHANISKKYGNLGGEGLHGFNEHLANIMAKDSLGQSYVNAETKFQNMWAGSSEKKSYMEENYNYYLKSKEIASDVPANVATVNILGNLWLKKKTDNILNNALGKLYPDEDLRENILKDAYSLSKIYQTEAFKITELSKKDTILSNFKAKRILSDVEKRTFKFLEEL